MSLGSKAVKGTIWAAIDRFGTMAINFIVNLVLANLLLPRDFGAIGVLTIFLSVSQTFIDGGFLSALVQKKDATQTDYSTIFYCNTGFSLLCYAVLFFSAPAIAVWFKLPIVCPVLRVISLNFVISAFNAVQLVKLRKELAFKTCALINGSSAVISGLLGIVMAFNGYKVWSLVGMSVSNTALSVVLYWLVTGWRPSLIFSFQSFRSLFSFGGYLLFANVLQSICQNLQGVIIGKRFSASDMGLYDQARKLEQVASSSLSGVLVSVLFPLFSNIQDDHDKFHATMDTGVRLITGIIFPLLVLFMIIGYPLVSKLYGKEWVDCVPYFRILCIGGLFTCLQNINFYAVAAVGRSRELFYWSFYKWGLLLALLIGGMFLGMEGIMWAIVLSNLNIFLVNAFLAQHFMGYRFTSQLKAMLPAVVICSSGAAISLILESVLHLHFLLIALFFVLYYILCLKLFKLKLYDDMLMVAGKILKRN